jgi:hypothetical protein
MAARPLGSGFLQRLDMAQQRGDERPSPSNTTIGWKP